MSNSINSVLRYGVKFQMSFIYAKQLKEEFKVYGHFYGLSLDDDLYDCRSCLKIISNKHKASDLEQPDAIVIMMNPGSSRPLDKNYQQKNYTSKQIFSKRWKKEFVPAQADNAQYQIMRMMRKKQWKIVYIINLSDLRNGNSEKFAADFTLIEKNNNDSPHCMTHQKRKNELQQLLDADCPIIAAWGSVKVLKNSAEQILNLMSNSRNLIGLRVDENLPWYRFASPYLKTHKESWLKEIAREINKISVKSQ